MVYTPNSDMNRHKFLYKLYIFNSPAVALLPEEVSWLKQNIAPEPITAPAYASSNVNSVEKNY